MSRLIEIYQHEERETFDDFTLPLVIGDNDSAQVRLTGVKGTLAYVGESRNHLFLQPAPDQSSLTVYHNDEPVTQSVWLKSGDVTRIGAFLIHWHLSGHRLEVRVTSTDVMPLVPPVDPPVETVANSAGADAEEMQAEPAMKARRSSHLRTVVFGLFLLLLFCAVFVLLANPLTVNISPAPDKVEVSGFPLLVPFGGNYLGLPGTYQVTAEKQGYRPLQETVKVSGPDNDYIFKLEKMPGLLDVVSEPPGAELFVDDVSAGETPLAAVEAPEGMRKLRLVHPRYFPHEETLEVKGLGKRQKVQVVLKPAWAKVSLQTEPPGAAVAVDGEEVGSTPLELELVDGSRKLRFSRDTYAPLDVELLVQAGQDQTPPVYELQPAPAVVKLTSAPSGATVTLGGQFQGQTPLTVSLAAEEEHQLRVSAAGYSARSRKVRLAAGEESSLHVALEPQFGVVFVMVTPPDASLSIDGKKQDQAVGRFRLPTRPHTFELTAEGFDPLRQTVTPQVGQSQRVNLELTRQKSARQLAAPQVASGEVKTAVGQKLVLIKPKAFRMGASRNEAGRRANEREHDVVLQRPYYLAAREVTNAEFRRYRAQHVSGVAGNRSLDGDDQPVVDVSWEDAARFLNWLSAQDGLPEFYREESGRMVPGGERNIGYRLPTEAEWAYAARVAGRNERGRYPWTGKYPPQQTIGNFADESARHFLPIIIEGYNDGYAGTAPVGSFAANAVGIFDLGGNVAEWCHDYYAANPGGAAKSADPLGPASGAHRVVRGSSWRNASITELRFSYRRYSRESSSDIGFRVARYAQ